MPTNNYRIIRVLILAVLIGLVIWYGYDVNMHQKEPFWLIPSVIAAALAVGLINYELHKEDESPATQLTAVGMPFAIAIGASIHFLRHLF